MTTRILLTFAALALGPAVALAAAPQSGAAPQPGTALQQPGPFLQPGAPLPPGATEAAPAAPATVPGDAETAALNRLEVTGFGDFSQFHADGGRFTATVQRQGRPGILVVNPQDGTAVPQPTQ